MNSHTEQTQKQECVSNKDFPHGPNTETGVCQWQRYTEQTQKQECVSDKDFPHGPNTETGVCQWQRFPTRTKHRNRSVSVTKISHTDQTQKQECVNNKDTRTKHSPLHLFLSPQRPLSKWAHMSWTREWPPRTVHTNVCHPNTLFDGTDTS